MIQLKSGAAVNEKTGEIRAFVEIRMRATKTVERFFSKQGFPTREIAFEQAEKMQQVVREKINCLAKDFGLTTRQMQVIEGGEE